MKKPTAKEKNTRAAVDADAKAQHPAGAEGDGAAPATHAPPTKTVDEGAAAVAAAAPIAETVDIGFPLPDDIAKALVERPELAAHVSVVVKAKSEKGRRRAGRSFTRAETVLPFESVSPAELQSLLNDAELVVLACVPAKPPG